MKWGFKKDIDSIWADLSELAHHGAIGSGCVFGGRVAVILGVFLVAGLGFKEFARATGLYKDWWMTGAVYLGIIAVGVTSLISTAQGDEPGEGWYGLFIALPVYAVALILLIPIVRNKVQDNCSLSLASSASFIWAGCLATWHFWPMPPTPTATCFTFCSPPKSTTWQRSLSENYFGKHRFAATSARRKPGSGALGALAVSMALPWLLRFSFPQFGATQLILAGLIVGIGGQLGDLAISVIKRDIGIKDMGAGIPGHGGILDRIDSLIYIAPLFFHMAGYFYGLR